MATDRPRADELQRGLTVELVQDDDDPHAEDTEPLIGEIAVVYGEDPDGPHVRLKSGVVGHVQSVVADGTAPGT
ncbi:uncharacterized protein YwbE [Natrinema hispanicum]|uniref:Uncharacterized protein YwbE n=1 Tax=Natrinema hispanicum TaxID=392421 RepID=A0A482YBK2_9EURY|nr:DUF2196 domain-containing protein [Natrinema hispanicum]RZV11105.1 uncharacterized protein YwbE [Natrinema hispanicum]